MISYSKIFVFMFSLSVAIQLVNYSGVFPESWAPQLEMINQSYQQMSESLGDLQNQSAQDILTNPGAYGFLTWQLLQFVLAVTVLAPVYVGIMLNTLFAGVGMPHVIGYTFTIVTYLSFVLWIVDVLRGGREVGQ